MNKDITAGIVLLGLGLYITYESIKMPLYDVYSAPGIAPGLCGIIITITTILLLINAVKNATKQAAISKKPEKESVIPLQDRFEVRFAILVIVTVLYFTLLGRVHFIIATSIYLIIMMLFLKAGRPINVVIIAVILSITIYYGFTTLLMVYMP